DIVVEEVGRALSTLIYLVALYVIVNYFHTFGWLASLLVALAVLVAGRAVVNIVIAAITEYIDLLPIEEDQKALLMGVRGSIKAVLYIIIVLVMLASVGIDVWPIITSLGIGGLAISMAMKDVLTDYISGLIVILGRSLKKGDRVLVKDKGVEGVIEEIGWRYTTLITDEGELVTVPNRVISSSVIVFRKEREEEGPA
ncbi:MAG: mechanosensitive ion channel, partial [Candidatus Diapherotrites archaeon]|nr:mechanosensitive ion channel [Candidatus Diapherotrites archaeon]